MFILFTITDYNSKRSTQINIELLLEKTRSTIICVYRCLFLRLYVKGKEDVSNIFEVPFFYLFIKLFNILKIHKHFFI